VRYHFPIPEQSDDDFIVKGFSTDTEHLKGASLIMEMTNTDGLKEQLMTTDPEFRELAREHGRYEARLSELSALTYPSDEEQLEEITLKKKKLAIKDQMHSIMLQYQRNSGVAH
jgi:uncharacterized protein YdcH (DUF465 family)